MRERPMTGALGILLTAGIIGVLWSNQRVTGGYASANRDLTAVGQERQQALMAELVKQQAEFKALTERMVRVNEIVSSFQDDAIKSRRFKGAQEKQRLEWCAQGILTGQLCTELPDPGFVDWMIR